jgi:hypothetical protein
VLKHWKVGLVLGALALLGTAGWGSREYFWGQQNGAKYRLAAVERDLRLEIRGDAADVLHHLAVHALGIRDEASELLVGEQIADDAEQRG